MSQGKYGKYIITEPLLPDPNNEELNAFHPEMKNEPFYGGIWLNKQLVSDTELSCVWTRWWDVPDPNPYILAHKHDEPEVLLWLPCGPDVDDLNVEVELYLGDELEKHTFRGPTVVYVPGGLTHTPIIYKNCQKKQQWYNIAVTAGASYP